MIERYTLPEMGKIWSEENKFRKWLLIEQLVCEALARQGRIPQEAARKIRAKATFDIDRIKEIEKETRHDVVAFLENVAESLGPESRYVHIGLTSSDLLDTATACLLKEAGELLLRRLGKLVEAVENRAVEHKRTVMVGRTHGVHAEPITFGLKLLVWYEELKRRRRNLERALDTVSYGKISGAVGTYAHLDPEVEAYVMEKLGLEPSPISTQIVQRDRHAEFLSSLALVAASLEKMATEVRNLQRTDVLEVEEPFGRGQKGSSAMPHKRNPVLCERICGLARLVRSYAMAGLENVTLWHERDISHSSVERVVLPDATIALDYMLERFTWVVENMTVYPERMRENLEKTKGLIFSQRLLLELVEAGMSRQQAYGLVQSSAGETWKTGRPFLEVVREKKEMRNALGDGRLEEIFDLEHYLRHVDRIFARVLS